MKEEASLAANETLGLVAQVGILLFFRLQTYDSFRESAVLPENLPRSRASFSVWPVFSKAKFSGATPPPIPLKNP